MDASQAAHVKVRSAGVTPADKKQASSSFLKKSTKKLLLERFLPVVSPCGQGFFVSFFQKRKTSSRLRPVLRDLPRRPHWSTS
jgi:hypothetical protein